tara:strand:- start:37 stop:303 length:267 start_codon:yes stop_codon:yes gene_type:complete
MRFSYKKGLSEEWYSQKLFWVSSLFVYGFSYIYNSILFDFYDVYRLCTDLIKIVLMIVLISMMLKTRKRTLERPRIGETIDLDKIGGD